MNPCFINYITLRCSLLYRIFVLQILICHFRFSELAYFLVYARGGPCARLTFFARIRRIHIRGVLFSLRSCVLGLVKHKSYIELVNDKSFDLEQAPFVFRRMQVDH